MTTFVDGVLITAWVGKTHRDALSRVLTHMRSVNANIRDISLTGIRSDLTDHYHNYGSQKEYGQYSESASD